MASNSKRGAKRRMKSENRVEKKDESFRESRVVCAILEREGGGRNHPGAEWEEALSRFVMLSTSYLYCYC